MSWEVVWHRKMEGNATYLKIRQVCASSLNAYSQARNSMLRSAGVAFYSILSFAPLLVLIRALIAVVFGHESAQGALHK